MTTGHLESLASQPIWAGGAQMPGKGLHTHSQARWPQVLTKGTLQEARKGLCPAQSEQGGHRAQAPRSASWTRLGGAPTADSWQQHCPCLGAPGRSASGLGSDGAYSQRGEQGVGWCPVSRGGAPGRRRHPPPRQASPGSTTLLSIIFYKHHWGERSHKQ